MSTGADRALILIAEDETALADLLTYTLEKEGYATVQAGDGARAIALVRTRSPALLLLDWMLPGASGIEICRRLRSDPQLRSVPILMLTARSEEADRVQGLETGADDYMTKPFSMKELLARIRALLRRAGGDLEASVIRSGGIEADCDARQVRADGRTIELGSIEFRMLVHLMRRPGHVFSRERLLDAIWGVDAPIEPRTVDVSIARLRKALRTGSAPPPIKTVRGGGYAFEN